MLDHLRQFPLHRSRVRLAANDDVATRTAKRQDITNQLVGPYGNPFAQKSIDRLSAGRTLAVHRHSPDIGLRA